MREGGTGIWSEFDTCVAKRLSIFAASPEDNLFIPARPIRWLVFRRVFFSPLLLPSPLRYRVSRDSQRDRPRPFCARLVCESGVFSTSHTPHNIRSQCGCLSGSRPVKLSVCPPLLAPFPTSTSDSLFGSLWYTVASLLLPDEKPLDKTQRNGVRPTESITGMGETLRAYARETESRWFVSRRHTRINSLNLKASIAIENFTYYLTVNGIETLRSRDSVSTNEPTENAFLHMG